MKLLLVLLIISCAKMNNIFLDKKEKILERELKQDYHAQFFYHFNHRIVYLNYIKENFDISKEKQDEFFKGYTGISDMHNFVLHQDINNLKKELEKCKSFNEKELRDKHFFNPLEYAAYFGYYEIFKLILEEMQHLLRNKALNPKATHLLMISKDRIKEKKKILELILEKDTKALEVKDSVGHNALMYAAIFNNIEMFKILYDKNPNLLFEETSLFMNTLDYLGMYGNLEIYKYLIEEKSIDINEVDSKGRTAFMIACSNDKEEFINYCLSQNVEVLKIDNENKSGMAYAAKYGHSNIFNKIKNISKEQNREKYQRNLLISLLACIEVENTKEEPKVLQDIMKSIISEIENINSTLKFKEEELTPLLYALKKGKRKSIELIIENKEIDLLRKKAFKYENVVEAAVAKNQLEALKLFFKKLKNEQKVNIELIKKLQKALKEAEDSEDEGCSSDEYLEMETFLLKEIEIYSKVDVSVVH